MCHLTSEPLRFQRLMHLSPHLCYRCQPVDVPGLEGKRPVSLYLPPDYFKEAEVRWPVAVFFDGQNIFDDTDTLAGGWHVHEAMASRYQAGHTVPVVIGIHHGSDRDSELSPWRLYPGKKGVGKALLTWLHEELLPRLARQLLIHTCDMLVAGSSLGGLMALYAVVHHPEYYRRALAMSPALWPDNFKIFEDLMGFFQLQHREIYLDHGGKEDHPELGDILFQQTAMLADALTILGLAPEKEVFWRPDLEGEHNETSWRRRLPGALSLLYEGKVS